MRTPFSPEILQAGTVRGLILIILAAVGRDFFFLSLLRVGERVNISA